MNKDEKLKYWVENYSDALYSRAFYRIRSVEIAEEMLGEKLV